ncbi:APH(3') family aminoglycoside O-phosphotransferase [Senegalia massiliensis]|uniref:Aminoglycoside 3'-phosphotransferase n=1 Tax=Senegalia massiliensis TaxID=1720316 RepID=A0A845QXG5_9CLOT|nr:APH(3') family aminoglycoside O-phosphotransferase [Senegalia massiliensis]NBI05842.1 aminoglycoside 3'-phosphotransferase [Senegalia massiliensis]
MKYDMPIKLRKIIKDKIFIRNNKGCSGSQVFLLKDKNDEQDYFLKIALDNKFSYLKSESVKLNWLKGKLSVPEVHYYEKVDGYEYLLLTQIPGKDALTQEILKKPYFLVKKVANGLRTIHNIDISDCSFNETIEDKLKLIKNMYNENRIPKIYRFLLQSKPKKEDLVFTHGDYCFPNIIINNNDISGFIDLGRSGIGDRYVDLSVIIKSIVLNYRNYDMLKLFLEEYGLVNVDYERLEYYSHIDKLIN